MVTMFDEEAARSRSHGLRPAVLTAQAVRLGLRQVIGRCTWRAFDAQFSKALNTLAADGITHVVFGDILFDEHRQWAERMCQPHGLTAVEPLFGCSTNDLFHEWIASGGEASIVTARCEFFDETWLGRPLRSDLLLEFERRGGDCCGERREYHTVVTPAGLLSSPIRLTSNGHVQRSDCWALDVMVSDAESH